MPKKACQGLGYCVDKSAWPPGPAGGVAQDAGIARALVMGALERAASQGGGSSSSAAGGGRGSSSSAAGGGSGASSSAGGLRNSAASRGGGGASADGRSW